MELPFLYEFVLDFSGTRALPLTCLPKAFQMLATCLPLCITACMKKFYFLKVLISLRTEFVMTCIVNFSTMHYQQNHAIYVQKSSPDSQC